MARKAREPVTIEAEVTPAPKASKSRAVTKRTSTAVSTDVYDWRKELAGYATHDAETELAGVSNWISFKGGVISYKGQPVKDNKLQGVVIAALFENSFYEGKFDPDNPATPICFAFGEKERGLAPLDESPEKQSKDCDSCQHNVFGSADQGRGKACKNIRRIGIIPVSGNFTAEDVAEAELAYARIPVMSGKAWKNYAHDLATNHGNLTFRFWVTEISTVPDAKSQFRVTFCTAGKTPVPDKVRNAIGARIPEAVKTLMQPYVAIEPQQQQPARRGGKNAAARRSKY